MDPAFEEFIEKVPHFAPPAKERTLFSLGGRGYYENAASDLIAFFMRPDGAHGFGSLFIEAFWDCVDEDPSRRPGFEWVRIEREVVTQSGGRIDMRILGHDWCLILENKIHHKQANPFDDYEAHAKTLRARAIFVILSPSGVSAKPGVWKGISYKSFCEAARKRLAEAFFDVSHSKWHLFAREFILHLENELYTPDMTPEQAAFLENHVTHFNQAQELLQRYPKFLSEEVKFRMEEDLKYEVRVDDENWAIRIRSSRWGADSLAFRPPTREPSGRFRLSIFTCRITPDSITEAQRNLLQGFDYERAPHHAWTTREGFLNRETALIALIERAGLIADQSAEM